MYVYNYEWGHPEVVAGNDATVETRVDISQEVWVKPPSARFTSKWDKGFVTGVNSANNIEVDYVPRHILDVRPVVVPGDVRIQEEEKRPGAVSRLLGTVDDLCGWMVMWSSFGFVTGGGVC